MRPHKLFRDSYHCNNTIIGEISLGHVFNCEEQTNVRKIFHFGVRKKKNVLHFDTMQLKTLLWIIEKE